MSREKKESPPAAQIPETETKTKSPQVTKRKVPDFSDSTSKKIKYELINSRNEPVVKHESIDPAEFFKAKREEKILGKRPIIIDSDEETPALTAISSLKESPISKVPTSKPSPVKEATPKKEFVENVVKSSPKKETDEEQEPPAKKKFNYKEYAERKAAVPKALGSKPLPIGTEGCLEGLTFVFTGDLSSIDRETAIDLARRYGAKTTTSISKKTSYLVAGEEPGPSKLKKAASLNTPILDEDGYFQLINDLGGNQTATEVVPESVTDMKSEPLVVKSEPVPIKKESVVVAVKKEPAVLKKEPIPENRKKETVLWTDKYRPKSYHDVIGNKGMVEKLAYWLNNWGQKSGSKDDILNFNAVLISGPPGIGKTSCAHLVCDIEGFEAIEFNASDTRSKKSIENTVKELTNSHTVSHFFGKNQEKRSHKQVIIMDEVDGMSAGDRGGNQQLMALIKKTKVPIICICNDRQSPKMRSLVNYCFDMKFKRPTPDQIEKRLAQIAEKEGMTVKPSSIRNLVESTQSDIRQILNLLSTFSLSKTTLSYDSAKALGKTAEKDITVGVWEVVRDLFSMNTFRALTFSQKMELYFNDYSLVPLMVQENYIKLTPALANETGGNPRAKALETLNCLWQAAESISDGDLVEGSVRTSNNWSLLPVHSVFSAVRPAFFMHGHSSGMYQFPGFLGNYSKASKYARILKDIHIKMRSTISGDKFETRQSYVPVIARLLVDKLKNQSVGDVIQLLDDYYLSKEDFDFVLEMGIGINQQDKLLKGIPTSVKSELTRTYNKTSHPIAFSSTGKEKVSKITGPKPDFEDVVEEDFVEEEEEEEREDTDKLVKEKKPKAKATKKSKK